MMSVLIYLMLTKTMITIQCAPKFGHISYDTLNLDSIKLDNKTKPINDINATTDVTEVNKMIHNIVPNKEDLMEAINQNITTQSDYLKSNLVSTTEAQILSMLSQENEISDTDVSSDWLDLEFNTTTTEIPKSSHTIEQTLQGKKECNTCADAVQSTTANEKNQAKEMNLYERSEINPLYNDKIRTETSKREIQTPELFFSKILRSLSGTSHEVLKSQEIIIDGYDYNINICRYFVHRYLCGYNKNIGEIKDSVEIEELGNGCIIRGDRMECGYKDGPWTVVAQKIKLSLKNVKDGNGDGNESSHIKHPMQSAMVANPAVSPGQKTNTLTNSTILHDQIKTNGSQACYEKDGRIVCYDVPT